MGVSSMILDNKQTKNKKTEKKFQEFRTFPKIRYNGKF